MSDIPCAICEKTIDGRLRQTYLTFYVEEEPRTYRLRACKPCTEDARNPFKEWGDLKGEDGTWSIGNSNVQEIVERKELLKAAERSFAQHANGSSPRSSRKKAESSSSALTTEPTPSNSPSPDGGLPTTL